MALSWDKMPFPTSLVGQDGSIHSSGPGAGSSGVTAAAQVSVEAPRVLFPKKKWG